MTQISNFAAWIQVGEGWNLETGKVTFTGEAQATIESPEITFDPNVRRVIAKATLATESLAGKSANGRIMIQAFNDQGHAVATTASGISKRGVIQAALSLASPNISYYKITLIAFPLKLRQRYGGFKNMPVEFSAVNYNEILKPEESSEE